MGKDVLTCHGGGQCPQIMGNNLTLFHLFGFTVRVHASWALLAGLIVWTLAAGYFPRAAPGLSAVAYLAMGLAGLAGLALSIVLHELAHSLVARRHDIRITGITLFVFGGVAEMGGEPKTAKGEFLMAVAGPAASVVIAALLHGMAGLAYWSGMEAAEWAVAVLVYLALINLLLAIFNLVPAFPLDGGRMLRAALWAWRGDLLWATRMATFAGVAIGMAIMGLGLWLTLTGSLLTGMWWLVIGFFVRAAAMQAWRQAVSAANTGG